jgi:hypothetical protein
MDTSIPLWPRKFKEGEQLEDIDLDWKKVLTTL